MVSLTQGPSKVRNKMQAATATLQTRQFCRDAHGLTVRLVPHTERSLKIIVTCLHSFSPNAFHGQRVNLLLDWNGRRWEIPGTIVPPSGKKRRGLDMIFELHLEEPHRFDEMGFNGNWSSIRSIRFQIEERTYLVQNTYFCGSRES